MRLQFYEKPKDSGHPKLTAEQVLEIRAARGPLGFWTRSTDKRVTLKELAKRYGVSLTTISQAANGRRYARVREP